MKTDQQATRVFPYEVYFAAERAARAALPPESRALIERHDVAHHAWIKAGMPALVVTKSAPELTPESLEVVAVNAALDADPLASFCMELRRRGNDNIYGDPAARDHLLGKASS